MNSALINNTHFDGWRPMDTAPRDGAWIELKCTYGVAPWYCIARWTDENVAYMNDGGLHPFKMNEPSWVKLGGGVASDESSLHWRQYVGNPGNYIDPTGGMQNNIAYWHEAVARKCGLPLDYFEVEAARNAKRNAKTARAAISAWWRRLLGYCAGRWVM